MDKPLVGVVSLRVMARGAVEAQEPSPRRLTRIETKSTGRSIGRTPGESSSKRFLRSSALLNERLKRSRLPLDPIQRFYAARARAATLGSLPIA